jgi:hypothetical protein
MRCYNDGLSMMPFDNRYLPYLCRANLLSITNIVRNGMPIFNTPAITVMVDRWRLETQSFHLLCGEMTMTLEDVAMILGLPIRGQLVIGLCDPIGWCQWVNDFLGTHDESLWTMQSPLVTPHVMNSLILPISILVMN